MAPILPYVKLFVALLAFFIGGYSAWNGVQIVVARELKDLEEKARKALADASESPKRKSADAPSLEDATKLVEAVTKLLGVKTGPGAFLCLFGLVLGIAGYLILVAV